MTEGDAGRLISESDTRHVALLSRLEFDEPDLRRFTSELNAILQYVDQLRALDTDGVAPTSHAIKQFNVFREDEPTSSLTNEEALANSPDREMGCFRVPRIIQD